MRRLDIHRSEELKTGRLSSSSVTPLMNDVGDAKIGHALAVLTPARAVHEFLGMLH